MINRIVNFFHGFKEKEEGFFNNPTHLKNQIDYREVKPEILEDSILKEQALDFIAKIDELVRNLPPTPTPKYIWTKFSPNRSKMLGIARNTGKSEYYGIAVSEAKLDALDHAISLITTEMIYVIEALDLVNHNDIENRVIAHIRFLLNKDLGNHPVMWFSTHDRFYSAVIDPSILIPHKQTH